MRFSDRSKQHCARFVSESNLTTCPYQVCPHRHRRTHARRGRHTDGRANTRMHGCTHAHARTHARTHTHTHTHTHSLTHSLILSLSLSLTCCRRATGTTHPRPACVSECFGLVRARVGACVHARACHACVQPADLESSQAVQSQQKIHSAQGLLAGSQVRRGRQCHHRRCRIIPSPPPPRPPDRPNLDRISCRRRGQHDDRGGEKEVLPASRD